MAKKFAEYDDFKRLLESKEFIKKIGSSREANVVVFIKDKVRFLVSVGEEVVLKEPKIISDAITITCSLELVDGKQVPMIKGFSTWYSRDRKTYPLSETSRLVAWVRKYQAELNDKLIVSPISKREQEMRGYDKSHDEIVAHNCGLLRGLANEGRLPKTKTGILVSMSETFAIDTSTGCFFISYNSRSDKIGERDTAILSYQFASTDLLSDHGEHVPFFAQIMTANYALSHDAKRVIKDTFFEMVAGPIAEIEQKLSGRVEAQEKTALNGLKKRLDEVSIATNL